MHSKFSFKTEYTSLNELSISSFKIQLTPLFKLEKVIKGVTVILDRSSSMQGEKIIKCRDTLQELFDYV